jgi:ribose transport system permease protein
MTNTSTPAAGNTAAAPHPGGPGSRPGQENARSFTDNLSIWLARYGVVLSLIALVVLFSVIEPGTFPTVANFRSLVANQSVLAVLSLAVLAPLMVGEFDLSVGASVSLSGVVVAQTLGAGWPIPAAIIAGLLCGGLVGVVNGILVARVGISSFVATLATATVTEGMAEWISGNQTLFSGINSGFTVLGRKLLLNSVPIEGVYVAIIAVILWYVFQRTPLGRQMLATGSGREAARLAGIPTSRRVAMSFVLAGVLAAVAGVLEVAQLGSATASVGDSLLLPAYAGAFLGATTIVVGRFNVLGTLIGVLLLAVGITGLQLLGAAEFISQIFNGCALAIAVSIAKLAGRSRAAT